MWAFHLSGFPQTNCRELPRWANSLWSLVMEKEEHGALPQGQGYHLHWRCHLCMSRVQNRPLTKVMQRREPSAGWIWLEVALHLPWLSSGAERQPDVFPWVPCIKQGPSLAEPQPMQGTCLSVALLASDIAPWQQIQPFLASSPWLHISKDRCCPLIQLLSLLRGSCHLCCPDEDLPGEAAEGVPAAPPHLH